MAGSFKATDIQRATQKVWFDVRYGMQNSPEARGEDTIVPRLTGEIARTRVLGPVGRIELYGWIKGASWSEYWTLVKEILALFSPGAAAGTLSFTIDDGTTATISAQALSVVPEGDEAVGAARHFSIVLKATATTWTFT